jgi:DNA-directed RNA polymerase subunit N (RpoN/RPB10)
VVVGEPVRCTHCGEVIGVYEPLVDRHARETSLAAGAAHDELNARSYHRDCYALRDDDWQDRSST